MSRQPHYPGRKISLLLSVSTLAMISTSVTMAVVPREAFAQSACAGVSTPCTDRVTTTASGISVTNNASLSASASKSVIFERETGQVGTQKDDGTPGYSAGTIFITNYGDLNSLTTSTASYAAGSIAGIWDASGIVYGIYGASVGGAGGDAKSRVTGGGDGGRGGSGQTVTIKNFGSVDMGLTYYGGVVGVFGASVGGAGGAQDDAATGDQVGGNAGTGGQVGIMNSGAVTITDLSGAELAYGVAGESIGNTGGVFNGNGGSTAGVTLTNSAKIQVEDESFGAVFPRGVRALSAVSLGGAGFVSSDGSDNGGAGGGYGPVSVTDSAEIDVDYPYNLAMHLSDYTPASLAALSGGIVAVAMGGQGAAGPQIDTNTTSMTGGPGGSSLVASPNDDSVYVEVKGATIDTSGEYVPGIVAISEGGIGGDGRVASYGGKGGSAGNVTVDMTGAFDVMTDGYRSYGLIARSVGGMGGDTLGKNGIIVLGTPAGAGGAAGTVTLNIGTDGQGGSISTSDEYATAEVAESLGGLGGDSGNSTGLFGVGPSPGAGGAAGTVVVNSGAALTTQGIYAYGILAQSIGGGGGIAGDTFGIITIGGAGGAGMSGNTVTVNQGGVIKTYGEYAIGLLAQSIGGGGGAGATSDGVVSIGGRGGTGSNGGVAMVSLNPGSNITTAGNFAYGAMAQSVGGGGGDGGGSFSDGVPALNIGGAGGATGAGAHAEVDATDTMIGTSGDNSDGVIAQSVGGGGGTGGNASGDNFAISLKIGGAGSSGGAGGEADATLTDTTVTTSGSNAIGVMAHSVGGGGGSGGAASAYSDGAGFAFNVAIGGAGEGGGGVGSANVKLYNSSITTGVVGTAQTDALGFLAQSIGGGGGTGGASVADALAVAVPGIPVATTLSLAVGGDGGAGGAGGMVVGALHGSTITTYGDGSIGGLAQSIGGGGGNGGASSSLAILIGTTSSAGAQVNFAIGGSGGKGGDGGSATISLDQQSSIETYGDFATAAEVQSIGGGGGNGGVGKTHTVGLLTPVTGMVTLALGGSGATAGNGGGAGFSMSDLDSIVTHGDGSRAALVQSIGGGGGTSEGGNLNLKLGVKAVGPLKLKLTSKLNLGSLNGYGGDGGAVQLDVDGTIHTDGIDSDGITAQSIGGGGGIAGSVGEAQDTSTDSTSVGLPSSDSTFDATLQVGAACEADKDGNKCGPIKAAGGDIGSDAQPVNLAANIMTQGMYADGIVLQSIGGGGGEAGVNDESDVPTATISMQVGSISGPDNGAFVNAGNIYANFNNSGDGESIATKGYAAHAVVMQSIGAGGGMAATGTGLGPDGTTKSVTVTQKLGSTDGRGNGGNITITDGWLAASTAGDDSAAVILQSIGGGGGILAAGTQASADQPGSYRDQLSVGGGTGNGGMVTVQTGTNTETMGARSPGIIVQSVGGGGGIETAVAGSLPQVTLLGGNGSGGMVSLILTQDSSITTYGAGSDAIIAQSIGGSGGIVGDLSQPITVPANYYSAPAGLPASAGVGNGNSVFVSVDGTLTTEGVNADGVIAQSMANSGLLGGTSAGGFAGSAGTAAPLPDPAGPVTVVVKDVSATGDGSSAVFAQSSSNDLQPGAEGPVNVTLNGTVVGGAGTGSGVWIAGGEGNTLTVGANASLSAGSGEAVRYSGDRYVNDGSTLQITNNGTITGNIDCNNLNGAAACNVTNNGLLQSATNYDANVANNALLVIGSPGSFGRLTVHGSFVQQPTAVLQTSVDFSARRASQLVVEGDSTLGGSLDIVPVALLPDRSVDIVQTQGTTTGSFTPINSPIFTYATSQLGQATQLSVAKATFSPVGLNFDRNEAGVAAGLQSGWDRGGSPALSTLYATLDQISRSSLGQYRQQLRDLSPGATLAPAAQMQFSMARFSNAMMSCPDDQSVDGGRGEKNCIWNNVTGRQTDQGASAGVAGFSYDSVTYQFGGQREIAPDWFIGGSAGYQTAHLHSDDERTHGTGNLGYAGLVLKRQSGPWTLSGALSGGYGGYSMGRNLAIENYSRVTTSDPDLYSIGAKVRAARLFQMGAFYVKPYLDLDAIYTRMPGYHEKGDALALNVQSSDQFVFAFSPSAEFGGRMPLRNGASLRPYAFASASILSDDDFSARARLTGSPVDSGNFLTSIHTSPVLAHVGAAVELDTGKGVNVLLEYDGDLSSSITSHAGSLKISMPF